MFSSRFRLHELFAALLALMVQLGTGAVVPRIDPVATVGALCHQDDDTGGAPSQIPVHAGDCLVCPVCGILHARLAVLVPAGVPLMPSGIEVVLKAELPPPSTAPPTQHRPPGQPRAPPTLS